jgi:hypothetical protein
MFLLAAIKLISDEYCANTTQAILSLDRGQWAACSQMNL